MAEFNSRQVFGYNKFNRSHRHFTSTNMAQVIPIRVCEVTPGEYHSKNIDAFARMLPFVNPAFADIDLEIAHYFVSRNAIDPHYTIRTSRFNGMVNVPLLSLRFASIGSGNGGTYVSIAQSKSLADYLGMYLGDGFQLPFGQSFTFNLMPFFAYHMVIDRFYRNPHLSDVEATRKFIRELFPDWTTALKVYSGSLNEFNDLWKKFHPGASATDFWEVARCNWAPDYFTTARPSADGLVLNIPGFDNNSLFENFSNISTGDFSSAAYDLSTKATIPALWDAELMQKVVTMIEHGGYSYFDFMKTIYNVDLTQSEYEDEYPVYLGGSSRPLSVDTVYQQAPSATSESGSGLGNQAGQGSAYNSNNGFSRRFSKAGYIVSVAVLRPQVAYLGGMLPMFNRVTMGDDIIPALADLSDQPVLRREIDPSPENIQNDYVFGYVDRYNDHRTMYNRASASLRDINSDWIMARKTDAGTISADWVLSRPSYEPFQLTDESVDHFFLRCHVQEEATLPLPYKSRPYVW